MIGEKGIKFTINYIEKFHATKNALVSRNNDIFSNLNPYVQALVDMDIKQKELESKISEVDNKVDDFGDEINSMRNIIALSPSNWRSETAKLINAMAEILGNGLNIGFHVRSIRSEIYGLLDSRMRTNVQIRLKNMQKTAALNGMPRSKVDKLNPLDVIQDDPKFIEGFVAIVKEYAIRFGVEMKSNVISIENIGQ